MFKKPITVETSNNVVIRVDADTIDRAEQASKRVLKSAFRTALALIVIGNIVHSLATEEANKKAQNQK